MNNKNVNYIALLISMIFIFSGCRKDAFEGTESSDVGITTVKVLESNPFNIYFTPFSEIRKVHLISVRRNAASNADLNTTASVNLTADLAAVNAYNTDNDTDFEWLPESIYTLAVDPGVEKTTTGFSVTFAPGEFSKNIKVMLDGSKWNLAKKYAVAYKLADPKGFTMASTGKDALVLISIKNAYDAVYTVDGSMTDANGLYKGDYPRMFSLTTETSNSVLVYDLDWDFDKYIVVSIASGGGANTGIGLRFTFDPVTNKIQSITDPFNATRVFTDVSGEFVPGERKINVKWTVGRWKVNETWTFKEER